MSKTSASPPQYSLAGVLEDASAQSLRERPRKGGTRARNAHAQCAWPAGGPEPLTATPLMACGALAGTPKSSVGRAVFPRAACHTEPF